MNLFSKEFKELLKKTFPSKTATLITGLAGTGKLFATKRALEDAGIEYELIPDIHYNNLREVYKTISQAPDKTYLLDVPDGHNMSCVTALIASQGKEDVVFKSKSLDLKFVVTGKLYIVTTPDVDLAIYNRCFVINGKF